MKKLFLFLACFATVALYSQIGDQELSDRDWYLREVNIGGVDIDIPFNEELQQVPMFFEETSPHFITLVCNSLEGDVERPLNGEDEFFFPTGLVQTLLSCDLQENIDFELMYFSFFYENIEEAFSFFLTIIDIPPDAFYDLRIVVPNGDYVVYSDTPRLSVADQKKNNFFALPNPVDNLMLIKAQQTIAIELVVYDVLGKQVFEVATMSNRQIDLSAINAGLYLVEITTSDGEKRTVKLIKN